jgi:uncharacterized OB-fold protein
VSDLSFSIPPLAVDETRPYWTFAARGQIRLQRCAACDHVRWPPSPLCPSCWEDAHSWEETSGGARLQSWVLYRRQYFDEFEPPYVVALGRLDAGPRLAATLVPTPDHELTRGSRLQLSLQRASSVVPGVGALFIPVYREVTE